MADVDVDDRIKHEVDLDDFCVGYLELVAAEARA